MVCGYNLARKELRGSLKDCKEGSSEHVEGINCEMVVKGAKFRANFPWIITVLPLTICVNSDKLLNL